MLRKVLLICGILSSLLYIAMNIFIPPLYEGYNLVTQTVSELSAIGAPTRSLWVPLGILYSLLLTVFAVGIWKSALQNRLLFILAAVMFASGILSLAWSPMHRREVIAAGGGTFTDTWHIIMAVITLLFMITLIILGAAALGKKFRIYSIITIILFVVFGIFIGIESPGISKNLPTPYIGIWERLNIAVYMIWIIVLAIILLQKKKEVTALTVDTNTKQKEKNGSTQTATV